MGVTFDVLGLGCVAVDDLLYVEAYPPPDSKVRVQRRERRCGGLTATALVTASRLGATCAYAATLGEDELSTFAVAHLRDAGVDVTRVRRRAGVRPIHSTIVVDETNHTRNVFSDTTAFESAQGAAVDPNIVADARVVLVDHVAPARQVEAARAARRRGVPVVADFERDTGIGFDALLAEVDHLVVPAAFARKLSGREALADAVQWLLPGRNAVAVTDGDRGCWFASAGERDARHLPAFRVNTIDTTGCGDVFHGAYAACLAREMGLADRVRYASAAAALKASSAGASDGIPTDVEVAVFLGRQA